MACHLPQHFPPLPERMTGLLYQQVQPANRIRYPARFHIGNHPLKGRGHLQFPPESQKSPGHHAHLFTARRLPRKGGPQAHPHRRKLRHGKRLCCLRFHLILHPYSACCNAESADAPTTTSQVTKSAAAISSQTHSFFPIPTSSTHKEASHALTCLLLTTRRTTSPSLRRTTNEPC